MRARWALLNANIKFSLREVNLREKPPELLKISPKGTVPVFITQKGEVIDESVDIMVWSLKNDPNNRLRINNREGREKIKYLIYENDTHFKYHLDRFKYASRYDLTKKDCHKIQAKRILYKWNEHTFKDAESRFGR